MNNYNQNYDDLIAQASSFMSEQGLPCDDQLICDGKMHRYSSDAKRNKKDEWYVGHELVSSSGRQCLVIIFGSWSDGSKYIFHSWKNDKNLSELERIELKNILRERDEKIKQEWKTVHDEAAQKAQNLWKGYDETAPSEEYLKYINSKKIELIGEVRFGKNPQGFPSLIIPLRNNFDEIRTLQYISIDNNGKSYKTFLEGGEKKGNFQIIGEATNSKDKIFIVEGYATGVSVHDAMQKPVVIAFDSGNLDSVAKNINALYPEAQIIIAGDNDVSGNGQKKAEEAAKNIKASFIIPTFPEQFASKKYSDFNDLYQMCGIEEVQKQLNQIMPTIFKIKSFKKKEEPCADFNVAYLPKSLQKYIEALSKTTNAHPIMLTSSVLTMVSAFIGTKVVMPSSVYYQDLYPNLWILCIAKSGQYKTTALNRGGKIAYDRQAQIFKEIKSIESHPEQSKNSELTLNKSLNNIILPTKLTAEAFLEYLSQGHQGVVYASEFSAWLQNLDKTHNNDFKAIWTEFYDVPLNFRSKTKTQGDFIIEKPFVSICGVSAMPWIQANLKPTDVPSGFFARFLIFVPPHQENTSTAFPKPIEEMYITAEQEFKDELDKILFDIGNFRAMSKTDQAHALIEDYHQYILNLPKNYGDKAEEILQPYIKRWSPYLIKLSMIMQLFIDSKSEQISDIAVMSAMHILMAAMKSTAMLFEGELGESEYQRKCRKILEFIERKFEETNKPVQRKTIMASKQLDGSSKYYDSILQTLIDQGKIERLIAPKKNEWEYSLIESVEKN